MLTAVQADAGVEVPPAQAQSSGDASARQGGIAPAVIGVVVVLVLLTGVAALVGGRLGGEHQAAGREGADSGSAGEGAAYDNAQEDGGTQEDPAYANVDPAFEEIIDAWSSSGTDVPLLLPTYTPFPVDGVSVDPFGSGTQNYYVWSDASNQLANAIRVEILPAQAPAEYMAQDTIPIDGEEYPYTEDTSLITGTEPQEGQYTVLLWVTSEGGEEYWYYVEMNTMLSPLPPEEFAEMVSSMERLNPSDV